MGYLDEQVKAMCNQFDELDKKISERKIELLKIKKFAEIVVKKLSRKYGYHAVYFDSFCGDVKDFHKFYIEVRGDHKREHLHVTINRIHNRGVEYPHLGVVGATYSGKKDIKNVKTYCGWDKGYTQDLIRMSENPKKYIRQFIKDRKKEEENKLKEEEEEEKTPRGGYNLMRGIFGRLKESAKELRIEI